MPAVFLAGCGVLLVAWSGGVGIRLSIYEAIHQFATGGLGGGIVWAIPMAYVAVQGYTDVWTWVLFVAYMSWTVAYDTQYAMCDRDDDVRIGVKSTAILFGRYDVAIISLLQVAFVLLMSVAVWHYFSDVFGRVGTGRWLACGGDVWLSI